MIGRKRCEKVLEDALGALERAGAEAAQATLHVGEEGLTRFANNYIHQNVQESDASLALLAAVGRKLGTARTNRLDRAGIAAAARQAVAIARQSPEDPDFPGLPAAPAAAEVPGALDVRTARLTPAARARLVARAARRSARKGTSASGKVSSGWTELAVANSAGTVQYCSGSSFGAACTAMVDGAAGSEDWAAGAVGALRAPLGRFGADAVRTALRARKTKAVEPGEWTVILAPRAAAELVDFLGWLGLSSQAHVEGRSCLCGKLGQKVVGENVTVRDDGLDPTGLPMPFDFEGVPRKRLTLVEHGVFRELPHSTRTARRMNAEPTGHSLGAASPRGGLAMHLIMNPGSASFEELVGSTGKGLLVSRFWYTNVAEPATATITGMTRDGLFLVKGGKVRGAVRNMRFTQSVLEALSRVEAVGSELANVGGEWGGGVTRVPALKIAGFRFTGATEF